MATVIVPPQTFGSVASTPVSDTVTVASTRVHNAAQPLTVLPSPSYAGSVAGRSWGNWFVECLTGPGQGLYTAVPTVFEDPQNPGLLSVSQVNLQNSNRSETATPRTVERNLWPGERGDNVITPYLTAVPTPRAVPTDPTLWTCVDLSGWMFHVTATGKVISAVGPSLPSTVLPALGGTRKTVSGTFVNGPFNGPNDLCFDPNIPTIIYVADTFNQRIAKVHETAPGVVSVTTYYTGGLLDPYSVYAEADGTLIVADRGNNRVVAIPQVGGPGGTAGTLAVIASGLGAPMVVRPFSDGNICVAEHGGTSRLLEMNRGTGAVVQIDLIRTQQGAQVTTEWIWMDVDDHGTCGPVDDIAVVIFASYQTLKRTSRDGTFKSYVQRGSTLQQGPLALCSDPQGHYPWAVAFSDTEAKWVFTGGGSTQLRQWRRFDASDVTTVDHSRYQRGRQVWASTADQTKPSIWLTAGHGGGHNFLGLETTETLDAMSWVDFAAWLRGGGNGSVPRVLTDAQVQDARYYVKRNARRGLRDATVDAIGHAAPPPGEPAPPPDPPTVTRTVAAGITASLIEIVDDPPDDPPIPDPPLPPPGDGQLEQGVWRQLVVPTRTVYQPRLTGDQNIAEGQPGAAQTIAPNPVSATGTLFRSYSGMIAGNGKVYSLGGGHAGHPGNCLDILDLATGVWTLPFQSECPPPYNVGGEPNGTWRSIKGGGVGTQGFSPTGRPWVAHNYRLTAVDTDRDRLLYMSGNGLGAYAQDGTWTQLAGRDRLLNEPGGHADMGILYDPDHESVWCFAGDTNNGLTRGIFEYSIAGDAWRRVSNWPAVPNWSFGTKLISAFYVPQTREAFLIAQSAGGAVPEFPNRLFRYNLETGALVWEQSIAPGTPQYDEMPTGWIRKADFRTRTNQLYCYTAAWTSASGPVAAGFWVFSPAPGVGGTWQKLATPNGPALAWWTLCYDEQTDQFIGLRARTIYCGLAGACGGIADTHLFTFN